ncbi:MAG: N-acetyltransferase [Terriglobales bacterium]
MSAKKILKKPGRLRVDCRNGRMLTMDRKSPALTRDEQPGDREQIRKVNVAAFGRSDEADLIDRVRAEGAVLLSLVAEVDGQIIGHILFSRMTVETAERPVAAVSLAPMAVLPQHQGRKVGSQLVRHGLERLCDQGERIVLVLGHKHYYPRFGFSSEKARNLSSPFPPDAFMALELADGALAGIRGAVRYPSAFGL